MKQEQETKLIKKLETLKGEVRYSHKNKIPTNQRKLDIKCEHCKKEIITQDYIVETLAAIKIEDKYYAGHSYCSPRDRFDKSKGRIISLGRALSNYEKGLSTRLKFIPKNLRSKEDKDLE